MKHSKLHGTFENCVLVFRFSQGSFGFMENIYFGLFVEKYIIILFIEKYIIIIIIITCII